MEEDEEVVAEELEVPDTTQREIVGYLREHGFYQEGYSE